MDNQLDDLRWLDAMEYAAWGRVQRRVIHDRLQVIPGGGGLCCSWISAQQSGGELYARTR